MDEEEKLEVSEKAFELLKQVQQVMDLEVFIFEAYKLMTKQVLDDYFRKVFDGKHPINP